MNMPPFPHPFPLPLRTCLFNSLSVLPECIYFELETKGWVARSSAPDRIFTNGNQISLFSMNTGLSKHIHTQVVTSTTKQHKQKALFDKSHQPKHSFYSPLAVAALYTHSNSLFFSSSLTCSVVSEALCEAYCGQLSSSAQIASASYRKKRRRKRGQQGTQSEMIWTWRKCLEFIYDMKIFRKQKSHNMLMEAMKWNDDRDTMSLCHYKFTRD